MTTQNVSEMMKAQAVKSGLCTEWTENWGNPDLQGLIDKYLHGIDFCIEHDFPSLSVIKEHFPKELLHHNHIYVDENIHVRNSSGIAVLNGHSRGMMLFDGLAVCDLYVRHDCDVTIDCSHLSKVFINVYDRARVKVIQRGGASVYVYKHGDECTVDTNGDVLIREKRVP